MILLGRGTQGSKLTWLKGVACALAARWAMLAISAALPLARAKKSLMLVGALSMQWRMSTTPVANKTP
jgi:hypothetical protein